MELLITAAVIALVVYGLERNRLRHTTGPRSPLAGSSDVVDRDTERITTDLLLRHHPTHP